MNGGSTVGLAESDLDRIRDALGCVIDPELGLDVVSLGLIYRLEPRGEHGVLLEMTLTTPGCPVSEPLPELAKDAAAAALGPDRPVDVDLHVVWDPPWTPARIHADALARLNGRGTRTEIPLPRRRGPR